MAPRGKRDWDLSDEDLHLWWRVTESVAPLPGRTRPEPPASAGRSAPEGTKPAEKGRPAPPAPVPARPRAADLHELAPDRHHGLDRRTANRFRRGQLPIDARVDLHGMTRERAHETLNGFLASAQGRGCRCVIVVTGKGQRGPLEPHTGVIKAALPRWLNDSPNRQRVLAFAPARPQHGGAGAFYVLLKRPR